MAKGNSNVKVLGSWPSPFVMRVQIALTLKLVEYDLIESSILNPKSELLLKSNPIHKKIPVLLHNDKPICESNVIVEYIDEAFLTGSSILPSDSYDRAIHRFWAAYVDSKWSSILAISIGETPEAKARALDEVKEGISNLEEAFVKLSNGKQFFGGDKIEYLDIAFGSFLGWLRLSEKFNDVKLLDEAKSPSLVAWADMFCADEAVKDFMPETDRLIEFLEIFIAQSKFTTST